MKGASASRASRRAISVLPTPVGPIIRMFLGVISVRSFSSTCWRRQRLRSAIATARLAAVWPTMWRSSSETISCGVIGMARLSAQGLDHVVLVGVDAQVGGDREALADDLVGRQRRVLQQRARRGLGVGAARADRDDPQFGLE